MTVVDSKKEIRTVNREELARLGFSPKDIDAAENMEKLGLFEMEPSADLVERTIARCIPRLKQDLKHEIVPAEPEPAIAILGRQPCVSPVFDPMSLGQGYFAALKGMPSALRTSAEWNELSVFQGLQQACLTTVHFARSRHDRPVLMLDNHNLLEPAWWGHDTGFRAFWNACQIVNKMAAESGVPLAACFVVLRPRLFDYSEEDLATIDQMLRKGTGDVWWIPYDKAGPYKALDLIVFGEERILGLREKPRSPVQALEGFLETRDEHVVRQVRREMTSLTKLASNIRLGGKLSATAAANVGTVAGIRNLMENVMSKEAAVAR